MTRNDRAALKLALALARNESPGRAQQIELDVGRSAVGRGRHVCLVLCSGYVIEFDAVGLATLLRVGRRRQQGRCRCGETVAHDAGRWRQPLASRPAGGAGRGEAERCRVILSDRQRWIIATASASCVPNSARNFPWRLDRCRGLLSLAEGGGVARGIERYARGRRSTRKPKAQVPPRKKAVADSLRSQNGGRGHVVLSWVPPTR